MTKLPGNTNLSIQKKEILNTRIFSSGYSLPIVNVLSSFLADSFKGEVEAAYQAFSVVFI